MFDLRPRMIHFTARIFQVVGILGRPPVSTIDLSVECRCILRGTAGGGGACPTILHTSFAASLHSQAAEGHWILISTKFPQLLRRPDYPEYEIIG